MLESRHTQLCTGMLVDRLVGPWSRLAGLPNAAGARADHSGSAA